MPITGIFTKRGAIPGYTFNGGFWPVSAETGRPPAGAARAMGFRQCRAGNKPCGKTCIRADRVCKVGQKMFGSRAARTTGVVVTGAGARKPRREPRCTEGITYKCGKACISNLRPCKKTNTPAPGMSFYNMEYRRLWKLLDAAIKAKEKAPLGSRERYKQGMLIDTLTLQLGQLEITHGPDADSVVPDTPMSSQPYRTIRQTGPNTFII